MYIQDRIAKVNLLTEIVESHLIGGKLSITSTHISYYFNEVYLGLNGVRVSTSEGKINALKLLIRKLDDIYNKEFSWSSHHNKLESLREGI